MSVFFLNNTTTTTTESSPIFQDYLGGIIVFVSIATALVTARMYSDALSPSLVALAINYTLLVPIYLNWVVKLLSDLEMYVGAVERISIYINPNDKGTSDNGTDESPCELLTIEQSEKCEYIDELLQACIDMIYILIDM